MKDFIKKFWLVICLILCGLLPIFVNYISNILSDAAIYEITNGLPFNWAAFFANPKAVWSLLLPLLIAVPPMMISKKELRALILVIVSILFLVIYVFFFIFQRGGDIDPPKPVCHTHNWSDATYVLPKTCSICGETEGNPISLNVGDTLAFGKYEQDGNMSNGAEAIQWMVLDIEDDNIFVITKDCIEVMQYHTQMDNITWEQCSLRSWLNDSFYNGAFTPEERVAIKETYVNNSIVPDHKTNGGVATNDRIYLLSVSEVQHYFSLPGVSKESKATAYTLERGAGALGESEYWWTRTPGKYQNSVRVVDTVDAKIFLHGDKVDCTDNVVRPVMWIDLSKLKSSMELF